MLNFAKVCSQVKSDCSFLWNCREKKNGITNDFLKKVACAAGRCFLVIAEAFFCLMSARTLIHEKAISKWAVTMLFFAGSFTLCHDFFAILQNLENPSIVIMGKQCLRKGEEVREDLLNGGGKKIVEIFTNFFSGKETEILKLDHHLSYNTIVSPLWNWVFCKIES